MMTPQDPRMAAGVAPAPAPGPEVRDVKMSQDEVAYGPAYRPGETCGDCVHFDGQSTCELVDGTIAPEMVCDLFEPAEPLIGG